MRLEHFVCLHASCPTVAVLLAAWRQPCSTCSQPGRTGEACASYCILTTRIDALVRAQPCLWLYLKLMWVTLAHLPGVRGACSIDGVDPQLVGDVSQPLQGFLVGFVVARHGFWSLSSQSFTLEKLIQVVWVTQLLRGVGWESLRHAVADCPVQVQPRRRRSDGRSRGT